MICAVVLAAGRSERMGTQKLLLPLGGKPVIARIVDELRQSSHDRIVVVVGRDGEKVRHALAGRDVTFATNPDFNGDMLSSIRCGLRATLPDCEAALIVLGDQPNLTAQLVEKLTRAFADMPGKIIVPANGGHRGHPLLIPTRLAAELLTGYEKTGLRGLLDAHAAEVCRIEVADSALLEDMDTPEDYQRLLGGGV
ncbi:MAG: nucleotidyltransferase family protein [Verrucomicrobia bacterium]|nr:MAG: nucleotidyltransferase family protein [Verrucomicrobiota bacterium]